MNKKSFFLYSLLSIIITTFTTLHANTLTVTTTADSGPGSLRQAMTDANSFPVADTIIFNIPQSDHGFHGGTGVWTIQPITALPIIQNDSTLIDATTQTTNQGNYNIFGPEIEIIGNNDLQHALYLRSSYNKIHGFIISQFSIAGILLRSESARQNIITGNYIGTDATGTLAAGNNFAIKIDRGSKQNIIGGNKEYQRNLLSGNLWGVYITEENSDSNVVIGNYIGVDISGNSSLGNRDGGIFIGYSTVGNRIGGSSPEERNIISGTYQDGNILQGNGITIYMSNENQIIGNYIGVNKDGNLPLSNIVYGISIESGAKNIVGGLAHGEANIISGNNKYGVFITSPDAQHNVILGNVIGTDLSTMQVMGNKIGGIRLDKGAKYNVIGPQNIIVNNGSYAVYIAQDTTRYNTITQNIIANHYNMAIYYGSSASSEIITPPPHIQQVTDNYVSGTTFPGWTVEIFSDTLDEASVYEGSVIADDTGNFTWYGTVTGPNVCATATDTSGGTSEFCSPIKTGVKNATANNIPQQYLLQQNYPNPFNPVTEIRYNVPERGFVQIEIYDSQGRRITILVNKFHNPGSYHINWNGRDAAGQLVPSGVYFYRLRAGGFSQTHKMLLLK